MQPLCRLLRLSRGFCNREAAAAFLGVYDQLLKGADCLTLVARKRRTAAAAATAGSAPLAGNTSAGAASDSSYRATYGEGLAIM